MQIDEDADGFHHRDEFVEGILKNKFPSSRLEMNAVADKFDHGDGAIDWRCVVFDESNLLIKLQMNTTSQNELYSKVW